MNNCNFSANTITANLIGNITGTATTAINFTGTLGGDVTGTQATGGNISRWFKCN